MRRFLVGVAILAVAIQPPQLARGGDRQIAEQIVQSLESAKTKGNLRDFNIGLHVEEGAVYLSGYVANRKQEQLALDAARKAEGVQKVFNEMEIVEIKSRSTEVVETETPATLADTETVAVEEKSVEAEPEQETGTAKTEPRRQPTGLLVGLTQVAKQALATSRTRPKVQTADHEVTSRRPTPAIPVATAREDSLADAKRIATEIIDQFRLEKQKGTLRRFGIDVEVDHGVVWLKGNVSSADHQELALEIARSVSGVTQVVNDLSIDAPARPAQPVRSGRQDEVIAQAVIRELQSLKQSGDLRGFGVDVQVEQGAVWLSGYVADSQQEKLILESTRYLSGVSEVVNDLEIGGPAAGQNGNYMPVQYTQQQTPLAFAPAHAVNHQAGVPGSTPVPMMGAAGVGVAPARYDHPQMPGYAWPSYAAQPNYGAVTYPKQHSASAWPYIGPFYPYPQVPLGWRKVTLEWDDGWWQLDFKDRHRR